MLIVALHHGPNPPTRDEPSGQQPALFMVVELARAPARPRRVPRGEQPLAMKEAMVGAEEYSAALLEHSASKHYGRRRHSHGGETCQKTG